MIEKKCYYCDKEVSGYTEKHAEGMRSQHMIHKHPEKIKWQ